MHVFKNNNITLYSKFQTVASHKWELYEFGEKDLREPVKLELVFQSRAELRRWRESIDWEKSVLYMFEAWEDSFS